MFFVIFFVTDSISSNPKDYVTLPCSAPYVITDLSLRQLDIMPLFR